VHDALPLGSILPISIANEKQFVLQTAGRRWSHACCLASTGGGVEGLAHESLPVFSVRFHPEAADRLRGFAQLLRPLCGDGG
jgi:hypothetical protein